MTTTLPPKIERVDIIGVPMDLGASRRGVDMGPSAVRYARLHERLRRLGIEQLPETLGEAIELTSQSELALRTLGEHMFNRYIEIKRVLGGDHSIAMGTLKGLRAALGKPAGLVWIDAHSDINSPETSPSGNVHGMPLFFALKNGYADPQRTVQIGLRDVDPHEKALLRQSGVRAFSMSDVDRLGMTKVMEMSLDIAGRDAKSVHVSFDMDGIDPSEAPGTGTPVKGGLSYREAHLIMEMLAESGALGSIEMVEINPILDQRNQTAILAVGLILSGLGKSIL